MEASPDDTNDTGNVKTSMQNSVTLTSIVLPLNVLSSFLNDIIIALLQSVYSGDVTLKLLMVPEPPGYLLTEQAVICRKFACSAGSRNYNTDYELINCSSDITLNLQVFPGSYPEFDAVFFLL